MNKETVGLFRDYTRSIAEFARENTNQLLCAIAGDSFFFSQLATDRDSEDLGLASRALAIRDEALRLYDLLPSAEKDAVSRESVIIVSLLHEISKSGVVTIDEHGNHRFNPHEYAWRIGQRSLRTIDRCKYPLTEPERMAILWHTPVCPCCRHELPDSYTQWHDQPLTRLLSRAHMNMYSANTDK